MSKHTPGPWHFHRRKDGTRILTREPKAQIPMAIAQVNGALTLGHPSRGKGIGHAEADANAKLMAAAPEMLKAAEDLLHKLVVLAYSHDDDEPWKGEAVRLATAVRKAKGGA